MVTLRSVLVHRCVVEEDIVVVQEDLCLIKMMKLVMVKTNKAILELSKAKEEVPLVILSHSKTNTSNTSNSHNINNSNNTSNPMVDISSETNKLTDSHNINLWELLPSTVNPLCKTKVRNSNSLSKMLSLFSKQVHRMLHTTTTGEIAVLRKSNLNEHIFT